MHLHQLISNSPKLAFRVVLLCAGSQLVFSPSLQLSVSVHPPTECRGQRSVDYHDWESGQSGIVTGQSRSGVSERVYGVVQHEHSVTQSTLADVVPFHALETAEAPVRKKPRSGYPVKV